MKELSLHILDIAQNSIRAGASLIEIKIEEDTVKDKLVISVKDNGKGMDAQTVEKVKDPFFTTRSTRKIGLGIPLLLAAAKRCDGSFNINSAPKQGTEITAVFKYSHIDRAPIGNIEDTITSLVSCNENVDFIYTHSFNGSIFTFDTREIKGILKEVPITSIDVIQWIKEYIKSGIKSLHGGVDNEVD